MIALPRPLLRRPRRRHRGAAMVEAVVVVSTMLIFMGLIVWMRKAYGAKLDLQQQTRSETFSYASNGCKQGGTGPSGFVPGTSGPADKVAGTAGLPDAPAVSRSWNSASGTQSTAVNWQATFDQNAHGGGGPIRYGKAPLAAKVSAATAVTCNEQQYDSQLTAWFRFGLDFAKGGGGLADLFR